MFRAAIVRPPGATFADGLTTARLGPPDLDRALAQHEGYVLALVRCGLSVVRLEPDDTRPDATFVEDTAVLTPRGAVLTRPGAPSRRDEPARVRAAIESVFDAPREILPPGTLDGGDVCGAGERFFIGISGRTNEAGARQMAAILEEWGYAVALVDIRGVPGLLHLKSGVAALDGERLVLDPALADHDAFRAYERIEVSPEERYAANCVRVNESVLIAEGFPKLREALEARRFRVIALATSEYEKMDGGLSCLSLRY